MCSKDPILLLLQSASCACVSVCKQGAVLVPLCTPTEACWLSSSRSTACRLRQMSDSGAAVETPASATRFKIIFMTCHDTSLRDAHSCVCVALQKKRKKKKYFKRCERVGVCLSVCGKRKRVKVQGQAVIVPVLINLVARWKKNSSSSFQTVQKSAKK